MLLGRDSFEASGAGKIVTNGPDESITPHYNWNERAKKSLRTMKQRSTPVVRFEAWLFFKKVAYAT